MPLARAVPAAPPLASPAAPALREAAIQRAAEVAAGDGLGRLLQRFRDEKGRKAQSAKDKAQPTIALLGDNLEARLDNHLFNAVPMDGSAIDKDHPCGLHAYTRGALPVGVVKSEHVGGKISGVHQIRWHWAGKAAATAKPSTMFPKSMPPAHVRTLIALKWPVARAAAVDEEAVDAGSARQHIMGASPFELVRVGAADEPSYYPKYP